MTYTAVIPATFLNRPNRFVARCEALYGVVRAHTPNTGRLRELLVHGAEVYLEPSNDPLRKTPYTLVAVKKGDTLVNIDSQAPNKVVYEALVNGLTLPWIGPVEAIRREVRHGNSRFDIGFTAGGEAGFLEVKGVTLAVDGVAKFPDAPTERGVKHITELTALAREGATVGVLFLVQMKGVTAFSPNDSTHPAFGAALREAQTAGVHIFCYDSVVTPVSLDIGEPVPVLL